MNLGQKIRSLRAVEGTLRGLGRPMSQPEVVRAMKREVGKAVSQSYLSQIEGGARPHMTAKTRELLARFFRVNPGFLVGDPEGYHLQLISELRVRENHLDSWLLSGAARFENDEELADAVQIVAEQKDSRRALLLLAEILRHTGMAEQLATVLLRPAPPAVVGRTK